MGHILNGPTTRYKHCWAAPWKSTCPAFIEHTAHRWKRGFHSPITGVTASAKDVATQVSTAFMLLQVGASIADNLMSAAIASSNQLLSSLCYALLLLRPRSSDKGVLEGVDLSGC